MSRFFRLQRMPQNLRAMVPKKDPPYIPRPIRAIVKDGLIEPQSGSLFYGQYRSCSSGWYADTIDTDLIFPVVLSAGDILEIYPPETFPAWGGNYADEIILTWTVTDENDADITDDFALRSAYFIANFRWYKLINISGEDRTIKTFTMHGLYY